MGDKNDNENFSYLFKKFPKVYYIKTLKLKLKINK